MIMDPEQTGKLHEVVADGEYYGMQTFDQALLKHLQAGRVSMEEAMRSATNQHDFKLMVAADGRKATSMESVEEAGRLAGDAPRVPAAG
jgi:twitching motility protein PilT